MRYRPELDGIRAIAVLAVMAVHTGVWYCSAGWMGVDVFFVLSGFLITTLLLDEHRRTGAVSLRRFYARRVLRLYPALIAVVLAFGAAYCLGLGYGPSISDYGLSTLRTVTYVEDLWAGLGHPDAFHHGWSLAVEEQFYLLWAPLLLLMLRFGRHPLRWALLGAGASWLACATTLHQGPASTAAALFFPWNRMGPLLLGAALAVWVARGAPVPTVIRSPLCGVLAAGAAIFLVAAGAYHQPYPNLAWESATISAITCVVIWHLTANRKSLLGMILASPPLRWLGRRSYTMYLVHLPLLLLIETHIHASLRVQSALMVVLTMAWAGVSYAVIERPFLRLKATLHAPAAAASIPEAVHPERERGAAHTAAQVGIA